MKKYQLSISTHERYSQSMADIQSLINRSGISGFEFDGDQSASFEMSKDEAIAAARRINNNIIAIDTNFRLLRASAEEIEIEDGEIVDVISL